MLQQFYLFKKPTQNHDILGGRQAESLNKQKRDNNALSDTARESEGCSHTGEATKKQ